MKSSSLPNFVLPEKLWEQIQIHLLENIPEEACGLVGGVRLSDPIGWKAQSVYPIENILHSPYRYRMDGRGQLAAFELIDQAGQDLIAIFHSHPNGPPFPSETDIKESYFPEVVYLIGYRVMNQWLCRGYKLNADGFQKINLMISKE